MGDSISVLEKELNYLNMTCDMILTENANSDDSEEGTIQKIRNQFNVISNYINENILYVQSYVDKVSKDETDTEYKKRIKSLINIADTAIKNDTEAISVYDSRPAMQKFNKLTDTILNDIDDFVSNTHYKSKEEVIRKRDDILDIISDYKDSMEDDVNLKVWINPVSVKRICEDALSKGSTFNNDVKSAYMDIIRLNNKISKIAKNDSMDKDIRSELVSASLRVTREISSFCMVWNKELLKRYPLIKA